MKRTAGPWRVVLSVPTSYTKIVDKLGNWLALTHIYGMQDEAEGNAYLIAAAPDLLAACEAQSALDDHARNCEACAVDFRTHDFCKVYVELYLHAERLRRAAVAKANNLPS